MELTPKAIEEAEFRQTFRGYDVDQVDEFLENVAAGVASLMKRLDASEGSGGRGAAPAGQGVPTASAAPEAAPAAASRSIEDNTDELRRTLILAQRTADAAIREAKEEAARLVNEARNSSSRQVAEADAKSKKLVADAEAKAAAIVGAAERMAEDHRTSAHARLMSEVEALEGTREQLRSDANVIDQHVEQQRQQLRGALAELQRLIDDPQGFRLTSPPPEGLIERPQFDPVERIGPAPTADSLPPDAPAQEPAASPSEPDDRPQADQHVPPGPDGQVEPVASSPIEISLPEPPPPAAVPETSWTSMRDEPTEPAVAVAPAPAVPAAQDGADERGVAGTPSTETEASEPAQRSDSVPPAPASVATPSEATRPGNPDDTVVFAALDAESVSGGGPPKAAPKLVGDADEDAFLAELRKAMTDDEPGAPRPSADLGARPPETTSSEFPRSRSRFGRRR